MNCSIYLAGVVLATMLPYLAWGEVCTKDEYTITYRQKQSTYKCGWWSWRRCNRYSSEAVSTLVQTEECCAGDYGFVDSGCSGECPYESAQTSVDCNARTCRDYQCDKSEFLSAYASYAVHENNNDAEKLFTADATCFVQFTCPDCSCTCDRKRRSVLHDALTKEKRSSCLCSKTEPCTTCTVSNTNLFEVRNGVEIWRKACSSNCLDCSNEPGCFSASVPYDDVEVTCTGSGNGDNGEMTLTFALAVDAADEPTFPDTTEGEVVVVTGGLNVGDVIKEFNIDFGDDAGDVTYSLDGAVSPSTGRRLFDADETDGGTVKVNVDVSMEPSHTYNLTFCAMTRRHTVCKTFTVELETIMTPEPTSPPPTTTTLSPLYCRAAGAWGNSSAMDSWCQLVCTHSTPYCPPTHCVCGTARPSDRSVCEPVNDYAGINGMYNWCDWNCNTEYPVDCRPEFCSCDPAVDWQVEAPWWW